jgi:hypothetical protein
VKRIEFAKLLVGKKRKQNLFRNRHQTKLGSLESRLMGGKCDT